MAAAACHAARDQGAEEDRREEMEDGEPLE